MKKTTSPSVPTVFELLSKVKGIGPSTIAKLEKAELDSAIKINLAGREGLVKAGLNNAIATLVIDSTPEAPAPKPEPKKIAVKKGSMGELLAKSFKARGTSIEEVRSDLVQAPAPKPEPVVAVKKPEIKVVEIDVSGHVAEGETSMTISNPLQMGVFAEVLGYGLPKGTKELKNLIFVDAQGRPVKFATSWVIQVVKNDGGTSFTIVSGDEIEVSYATVQAAFKETASVKKMWLSKAIERIFTILRQKAEAAKTAAAAEEERQAAAKAAEEQAAEAALLAEMRETIISDLVRTIGSDPRGPYWLTTEQVASAKDPLQDLPRIESLIHKVLLAELGITPTSNQAKGFSQNLSFFMAEYTRRMLDRVQQINSGDDHRELVRGVQGYAGQANRYPNSPFVMLRFHFNSIDDVRYLIVHEDLLKAVRDEFADLFQIRLGAGDFLLDWIGMRGFRLVGQAKAAAEAKAAAVFAATSDGQALLESFGDNADSTPSDVSDIVL